MGHRLRSPPPRPHRQGVGVLACHPLPPAPLLVRGGSRSAADDGCCRGDGDAPLPAPLNGGGGRGGGRGSIRRASPVQCLDAEERRVQAERALLRPFPGASAMRVGVDQSTPKTEKCFEDSDGCRVRYGLASMQAWRATAEDAGPHPDFEGPTCETTACLWIIRNDQLVVANAGDYRCIISRNGQAHDLSRQHKPDLVTETEMVKDVGGLVVAGRVNGSLNLSRAIGDMKLKTNERLPADRQIVSAEPEVNTVQLSDDDEFIVLACDGIWDCMSSQKIVDFVHEKLRTVDSLSVVCEKMLNLCLAPEAGGDGCNNMTVIVVQFKKPTKSAAITSSAKQSPASMEELRPIEPDDPTTTLK